MLLDTTRFSFIAPVEAGSETILGELRALDRDDFIEWPDRGAYQGAWLGFPLFFASFPAGLDAHFGPNQERCPRTTAILRSTPGIISAGFSWLEPGCHILPHTDTKPDDVLRAHLGLQVPEGSLMRVGDQRCSWKEGECLIFDGAIEHETANTAARPRIVLLFDAKLTTDEFAYLQSTK